MLGKLNLFCWIGLIALVVLMWKWMGLFLRRNHLLRGWLSPPNWIGAVTLFLLLKLSSWKLVPSLVLWSFFFMRLLCRSINLPYDHEWNTVVMSGLVLLVATRNYWIGYRNRYAELLVLHLLPLWNPCSLSKCSQLCLFYRYCFGRCSTELAQLVPLPYYWRRSTRYSDRLHGLSVTIPRCYKDAYVNSIFPCTATLWNSLPLKCFLFTYDLHDFKSRIDRHLLTVGSF